MRSTVVIHIAVILLLALAAAGCAVMPKPVPRGIGAPPKDAPPEYIKGWNEGCESGYAALGNAYYKSFYKFKNDPAMLDNRIYLNAWSDAFNYCRHYINRFLASGLWWGEGFDSKAADGPFGNRDQRRTKRIEEGPSIWPEAMQGLNTPGWGETGWGGGVKDEE